MIAFFVLSLFSLISLTSAFVHPGLLVTDQDISRAKQNIAAGRDPWLSSWKKLTSIQYASASYKDNAVSGIYRSDEGTNLANGELLWHDVAAAFNLALRWRISGDDSFADAAARILTAWGKTLQVLGGGDDKYLTAGLQGYEIANAAELLRDYAPFAKDNLPTVIAMITEVFLPLNYEFLEHKAGSEHNVKHFYANWELSNVASMQAIAVLTDNTTTWDYATNYFKNGSGNGAINNAVVTIVSEPGTGKPLGQGQEEGRDQGHSALDYQLLAAIGQQAWNQGEDLFAYNDSRILLGAEYFARYNLGYDVPFETYTNGIVTHTEISSQSRGAIRPTWELLYNHYVVVKGLDAPWTEAYLNKTLEYYKGFEGGAGSWGEGSGHYDGLGWGSLLYRMDASDAVNLPNTTTTAQATSSMASTLSSSSSTTATSTSSAASFIPTTLSTLTASSTQGFHSNSTSLTTAPASSSSTQSWAPLPTTTTQRYRHRGNCSSSHRH